MAARQSTAKRKAPAAAKRGPGQPRHVPNDEIRALIQRMRFTDHCTDEEIAEVAELSLPTLRKYYGFDLRLSRLKLIGDVGASLYAKAVAGDTTAAIFILKTQAGWRETNRTELTGPDGKPLESTVNLPPLVMVEYVDAEPEPDAAQG